MPCSEACIVFHLASLFSSGHEFCFLTVCRDKTPGGSVPGSAGSLRGVLLGPEGSPSGLGALRRFLSDGFGWRTVSKGRVVVLLCVCWGGGQFSREPDFENLHEMIKSVNMIKPAVCHQGPWN